MSCALLLLALVLNADDPATPDRDALQGTWEVVESEAQGQPTPEGEKKKLRIVVEGKTIRVTGSKERDDVAEFTLDPTQSPKQINARMVDGPHKGEMVKGIYKIDGGRVRFCWTAPGGDRPADFKTSETGEERLFVVTRAKR